MTQRRQLLAFFPGLLLQLTAVAQTAPASSNAGIAANPSFVVKMRMGGI